MSFENPTRLRVGMHGNFGGRDYRLIGRVVLGVTDDGETYYWNEFNLEGQGSSFATLVFEQTERGGEWRLFTMFDPEYPMTAADAATKRVGDRLNLNGTDVRVTLLDISRVYHIEGTAPEGVTVGEEANYFNAEAGNIMQVVSWTGEEVEFYNGVNLSGGVVTSAFKLPQALGSFGGRKIFSSLSGSDSDNYNSGLKFGLQAVFVIFLFFMIFGRTLSCSTDSEAAPTKHISASTPPLAVGATGQWQDKHYRITAHAVVEIAQVGLVFERHQYELADDNGINALLVCGTKPDADEWIIFERFISLLPPPAASLMATKMVGDRVELDGFSGKVSDIFRSTIQQSDGDGMAGMKNGSVFYGLLASSEYRTLLARWNGDGITYLRGKSTTAKKLKACFTPAE